MEKRTPFFLTSLFRRSPQDSEFGEQKGWGDTTYDTKFGGWGSSPGSTSSRPIANGWADEPPDNHYNGSGSGTGTDTDTLHRPPTPDTTSNGWAYEKLKSAYNGWGCSPHGKSATPEASSSGWLTDEPPELTPVPSTPPLPDKGFSEHHDGNYTLDHLSSDFVKQDVVSMNQSKNGDAWCVVCWDAPVEGACVPSGHMVSCMPCLREIESKQGTCPVCRANIEKVLRIYAISTE